MVAAVRDLLHRLVGGGGRPLRRCRLRRVVRPVGVVRGRLLRVGRPAPPASRPHGRLGHVSEPRRKARTPRRTVAIAPDPDPRHRRVNSSGTVPNRGSRTKRSCRRWSERRSTAVVRRSSARSRRWPKGPLPPGDGMAASSRRGTVVHFSINYFRQKIVTHVVYWKDPANSALCDGHPATCIPRRLDVDFRQHCALVAMCATARSASQRTPRRALRRQRVAPRPRARLAADDRIVRIIGAGGVARCAAALE